MKENIEEYQKYLSRILGGVETLFRFLKEKNIKKMNFKKMLGWV